MRVLVYGATGSQSSPIVWKLLEHGHEPLVVTRNPAKATEMQDAGAQIVQADMGDAQALRAASSGADAVALQIPFFLEDPTKATTFAQNAIDAAKSAGVKLIVWNTSGPMPPARSGNPGVDVRIDVVDMLRASGVPHIIIEPTGYMENLLGPWTAPAVVMENVLPYPNPEEARTAWIASQDVGAFVVAALERPELAGQHFKVSGLENVNGPELAEQFTRALGRPITYYAMEPEEFGAVLDKVFGPGAGAGAVVEYRKMRSNPPVMFHDMPPVLAQLPVEMTSLEAWVRQHRHAFTPIEA